MVRVMDSAPRRDTELRVPETQTRDLTLLDRSDVVFAVLYGSLFLWGLIMTLAAL
jgi:hypothetical protein